MNSLEFKYPLHATYFLLPVLALVLFVLAYRKKEKILRQLKSNIQIRYKALRTFCAVAGMVLLVFSLLGPQVFNGFTEVSKRGLDIYILVDTSKSMLVEDIQPNRISRAKKIIEDILNQLDGDRIGFIPFSSDAYIQMPLTDDYTVARMFLNATDTDMIGGGGTNIASAIKLAINSFDTTSSTDRVLVILSDGEEHDSASLDVLKSITNQQLKIYTIGVGTEKGGLIPVYDSEGKQIIEYKKDASGNFITSRLNPDTLKELAASSGGAYYPSSLSGDEVNTLLRDISTLKRGTLKTDKIRKYMPLYQYFLGAGILLFLATCLLPERRKTE